LVASRDRFGDQRHSRRERWRILFSVTGCPPACP
jgi:hypothetical protein